MCFESVGFDDQQRVVVESGDLSGAPCEAVDVAVSVPLGDDSGRLVVNHVDAVEYDDDRPVCFGGASADVDDREVSVRDGTFVV